MHELSNEPVRNSHYSSPEGLLIVAFSEFSHARTCFPSREAASLPRYAGTRVPLLHSALPLPRLQTRSPATSEFACQHVMHTLIRYFGTVLPSYRRGPN